MKIIITGANGQLGSAFRSLENRYPQHQFFFFAKADLDIADADAIAQSLAQTGAGALVNCAAYTAVDKAETDFETALAINCAAPAALAKACKAAGAKFIHISTDYVFDGTAAAPYTEDHPVKPVNAYGLSKQKGEEAVLEANAGAVIIRTSWVYSPWGANFVKTMLRLMQSRPEVGVVADQWGSPTYAPDLAEAILKILESSTWVPGIYHFSNDGAITWHQFAMAIRDLSGFSCGVKSLTTPEYPTPARRPHYSVLDKSKMVHTFGIALKPWHQSLQACLAQLKAAQ